ncbi:MAG: hypothetical protein L3J28_04440 [Candidatus Polarisedimenticolaceae bacterium]|nr:hypothetical protein [Candidatus Polarisedimenticolaceae bacterium]
MSSMIPDRAIPLVAEAPKKNIFNFSIPGVRSGCSIEHQQSRAFNNLHALTESISEDEKWLEEIESERRYEQRFKRAGHASPSGPHTRLCYWYFESKLKRQLLC